MFLINFWCNFSPLVRLFTVHVRNCKMMQLVCVSILIAVDRFCMFVYICPIPPRAGVDGATSTEPRGAAEEQRHEKDDSWTYVP